MFLKGTTLSAFGLCSFIRQVRVLIFERVIKLGIILESVKNVSESQVKKIFFLKVIFVQNSAQYAEAEF